MADEIDVDKLWDTMKSCRIAMLTTLRNGHLRARPMSAVVQPEQQRICFLTQTSNELCADLEADPHLNICFLDRPDETYISVAGTGRLVKDPALARELWSAFAQAWFPEGPTDPSLVIVLVEPGTADYWSGESSRLIQTWELAKSLATGTQPDMGSHEQFRLEP